MARVLPFLEEFGLTPSLEPVLAEDAEVEDDAPTPLGHDLGFDPTLRDLSATSDGDLRIVDETQALSQWVFASLETPTGEEIVFSPEFGSSLMDLIASGIPAFAITPDLTDAVQEALLVHDRVAEVEVTVFPAEMEGEPIFFVGTIVLDDDQRLSFTGGG